MKGLFLAGRIVFGGFFLYNGINHFLKWRSMAQYAGAKGVPQPEAAVIGSGALLALGGALIALGIKPKIGAAAIVTFLAGVSPVMHDFWARQDPNEKMQETINFTKNVALLGGALALLGVEEPWALSVPVERPRGVARVIDIARKRIAA